MEDKSYDSPGIDNQNLATAPKSKFNAKTAIIIAFILILGALAYSMKSVLIAASVNGSYIWRLSVMKELEKESGKDILDALISEKLIHEEAVNKGIKVTTEEIEAEVKVLEGQIVAQGETLENLMETKNINMKDIKRRIRLQLEIKKLLDDKVVITDADITAYIKENKIVIPKGQEATFKAKVKDELTNQKIGIETDNLLTELRAKASVSYFVSY